MILCQKCSVHIRLKGPPLTLNNTQFSVAHAAHCNPKMAANIFCFTYLKLLYRLLAQRRVNCPRLGITALKQAEWLYLFNEAVELSGGDLVLSYTNTMFERDIGRHNE